MRNLDEKIVELIPALRRYATSLARNRADAEDLLQDSIATALTKASGWRGENLRGWMSAIMTNLYRNQWRRRATQANAARTQAIVEQAQPRDGFERSRIVAALDRLDPDQRSVLMLVVVEGYSYAEVATLLDIPMGTVMSRLSRARQHLAAELGGGNVIELRRP